MRDFCRRVFKRSTSLVLFCALTITLGAELKSTHADKASAISAQYTRHHEQGLWQCPTFVQEPIANHKLAIKNDPVFVRRPIIEHVSNRDRGKGTFQYKTDFFHFAAAENFGSCQAAIDRVRNSTIKSDSSKLRSAISNWQEVGVCSALDKIDGGLLSLRNDFDYVKVNKCSDAKTVKALERIIITGQKERDDIKITCTPDVIFKNACATFFSGGPIYQPEFSAFGIKGPAIWIYGPYRRQLDAEVDNRITNLAIDKNTGWRRLQKSMETLRAQEQQAQEAFESFLRRQGASCGYSTCFFSQRISNKRDLDEGRSLWSSWIAVKVAELVLLKQAATAGANEFGNIPVREQSREIAKAEYQRLYSELEKIKAELKDLPSPLARSANSYYRKYSPEGYLKAVELATILEAKTQLLTKLRSQLGVLEIPEFDCRVEEPIRGQ